jgi:polyferredoxin
MSRCTDCKGCDKACFMGVVPRKNKRDISCVNCGACIDACKRELGDVNRLFYYRFGDERVQRILRARLVERPSAGPSAPMK